eukprot:COSAG02_NODE_12264_length_1572_cov_0.693143_1_plen_276_part_10
MDAELSRQSSRIVELEGYLTKVIGLPAKYAKQYADGLCEEGFDTVALFDSIEMQELIDDYGFKKGQALKVQMSQMERGVGRFAPGAAGGGGGATAGSPPARVQGTIVSEPAPAEEGVPPQLPDGSTVALTGRKEDVIGRGASGIVRKGVMTRPSGEREEVACKSLAPGATRREHEQFQKEYQTSIRAALTCPGAAKTYGCCRHEKGLELVMKLYTSSLLEKLEPPADAPPGTARTPFAVASALGYGRQLATALAQLHQAGIKVGDVKPANLLIDER